LGGKYFGGKIFWRENILAGKYFLTGFLSILLKTLVPFSQHFVFFQTYNGAQ
jgi:hypothetical protein